MTRKINARSLRTFFVLLRALAAFWALPELFGYLWFSLERSIIAELFALTPLLALTVSAFAPDRWLRSIYIRMGITLLLIAAIWRYVEAIFRSLATTGGFVSGATMLQGITVLILLFLIARVNWRLDLTSQSMD